MSVAKVIELSATSEKGFEDAVVQGLSRASKTIHNIRSAWVKEMRVDVDGGKIRNYQVNMQVTFILEG